MASHWGRKESIITPPTMPVMTYTSLAVALLCTMFFMWQRMHFAFSPLQNTYVTDYLLSSVGTTFKHSGTYQLIYLQGGKVPPRLALPVDFVEGTTLLPSGKVAHVGMSELAQLQGHKWFGPGAVEKLSDASLSRWLRFVIFDGKSLSRLFLISYIEGAICLAVMLWFAVPSDYKRLRVLKYGRILRGPVMLTPEEFNHAQAVYGPKVPLTERLRILALRFIGKPPARKSTEGIGFKTTELGKMMRVPAGKEAQHFQLMGDTGAGKTTLIMQILRQIRDRGDVAIVYDPAGEFVQRFYDEERGDVILNPLDKRCPFWSPAMEIERNQEAVTIAESLYQPTSSSGKNEFFYRTPAQIFAHLLKEGPTPHVLAEWMADEPKLQEKVEGTEMAFYIDRKAGPQAAGVLASLGLVAQSLRMLPRREDTDRVWNATDWAKERRGWIFLTSQLSERELLRPLISLWIDTLVMRLLAIPKPGQKQVWFVIDELASLQKLPQLHTAITESRKSKNPLVLGFQGKAQLEDIYGRLAEVMLSQPATKIFMKTTEPKAAEWISETIGKVEIERLKETRFDGSRSGRNFTIDRQVEPLVMASEIAGLDDRHAFLKLGNNVARFDFAYLDMPIQTTGFIPRYSKEDQLQFDRTALTRQSVVPPQDAEEPPTAVAGTPAPSGPKHPPAARKNGGGMKQKSLQPVTPGITTVPPSAGEKNRPTATAMAQDFLTDVQQFQEQIEKENRQMTATERDAIKEEWDDYLKAVKEEQALTPSGDPLPTLDLGLPICIDPGHHHHHHDGDAPLQIELGLE